MAETEEFDINKFEQEQRDEAERARAARITFDTRGTGTQGDNYGWSGQSGLRPGQTRGGYKKRTKKPKSKKSQKPKSKKSKAKRKTRRNRRR